MKKLLIKVSLSLTMMGGLTLPSHAALISPDSATATSEFSSSFDIGNAIDGSGLPTNFSPTDSHADYSFNNYWTTGPNAPAGVSATFLFDNSVTLDAFYLWNHRFEEGFSDNPYYGVTKFDLIFKDINGDALFSLLDQSATTGLATAQTYSFGAVAGVRSVDFVIDSYEALDIEYTGTKFTGIAEVAFNTSFVPEPPSSVPEPSTVVALAMVGGSLLLRKRMKRG